MKLWYRLWQEDDGVLSFEWTLMITLLVIGIVGGLAAARDAIIDELGDIARAAVNFNQSYSLPELEIDGQIIIPAQEFIDTPATISPEGMRASGTIGQAPSIDDTN